MSAVTPTPDHILEAMMERIPAVMAAQHGEGINGAAYGEGPAWRRARPSRAFFVQQATLNTLHSWYPSTIAALGVAAAGEDLLQVQKTCSPAFASFLTDVRAEFNRIEAAYAQ